MPDLREKVLALADNAAFECGMEQGSQDHDYLRTIALTVAALVAEECARECDAQPRKDISLDGTTFYIGIGQCAAAIRRLAETLK